MAHVNHFTGGEVTDRYVRRLANRLRPATIREWAMVVEADHGGRPPLAGGLPGSAAEIVAKAEALAVKDAEPRPILMGRHLVGIGWKPGPRFGRVLQAAFEAQLDGVFSDVQEGLAWVQGL